MSQWDQDFVDEEEGGYFEFRSKDQCEFHFGYVRQSSISCSPDIQQ